MISQFTKNNIISRGETSFDATKKIEKSTPRKTEESVFEPIEVSVDKLDNAKLKILRNKNLSTTISTRRYTLSDINDLVNKIDSKAISRDGAIHDIAKKGKEIANLRQTMNRQTSLEFVNSLEKIFDEIKADDKQPDTTDIPDLESEESAVRRRFQPGKGLKILAPNEMLSR